MITSVLLLSSLALVVHECGHLLAALALRVKVSKFCLFFDPWFRLIDKEIKPGFRMCLGWIPFGAYVHFASSDEAEGERCLLNQHPLKRMTISLSGVVMNFVCAYLLMFIWAADYTGKHDQHGFGTNIRVTNYLVEENVKKSITLCSDYWQHSNMKNKSVKSKKFHKKETSFVSSWQTLVWRFACMNLFLALFNILPIPPLDGAHVLYNLFEMITGKPVNTMFQIVCGSLGFIVIMGINLIDLFQWIIAMVCT